MTLAAVGLLILVTVNSQLSKFFVKGKTAVRDSGYQGTPELWQKFLKCWESETLEQLTESSVATELEQLIVDRQRQSYEPALELEITEKEQELGITLPRSYRDFLLASNGWLQPRLDDEDGQVLPVKKVGYFSDLYPDEYKAIMGENLGRNANDGDFSEEQDPILFNKSDLRKSIAISDYVNNGVYLINLNQKSPENESSVWFFSSKHPGVYRFVSFAHMMQYAYIKTVHKPEDDIPYGHSYIQGTCAEILGYPHYQ
ncbi:hypothetical protein BTA51_28590 [Hahella sp. CCB-MM4]|nr:hypothetical protein BTA51_28590 [Hahella sp. CCB-MM4]